ncbi:MAG: DUF72 domain-containing protein [Gammaproteobacteria bacterium]
MQILTGTSGYSYKAWKGSFYPPQLADREMLRSYAQQLPAVELNNTFYRLPSPAMVESWAAQTPDDFRFAIKAPRRITHIKRLNEVSDDVRALLEAARTLGPKLGALLFQLPPYFQKNPGKLETFLDLLPNDVFAALEFRHPSWLHQDVYEKLRARNVALCSSDTDEAPADAVVSTADWGYLRLRRVNYSDADLNAWLTRLRAMNWTEAFVFFKHEEAGTGPRFAKRLRELAQKDR